MISLVNAINSNATLSPNFEATIVKGSSGGYSIAVIAKGSTQPIITTNLFVVSNQTSLPDASSPLTIKFNPAENLLPLNITFNYSNMMESVHKEMFGTVMADGMSGSTLANISIDNTGDLIGVFVNGTSKKLYKIPLATYANVNGLEVMGDNALRASALSGKMQIQSGGSSAIGEVLSGNIESSNIDQAEQLTNLITNKQYYNMNTKSWQTGNAILDYLLTSFN
jgi:flagellar hook-basal body protein